MGRSIKYRSFRTTLTPLTADFWRFSALRCQATAPTLYDAFESSLFVSILPFRSNILHQPHNLKRLGTNWNNLERMKSVNAAKISKGRGEWKKTGARKRESVDVEATKSLSRSKGKHLQWCKQFKAMTVWVWSARFRTRNAATEAAEVPLCSFFPLFRRHGIFLLQSLWPPEVSNRGMPRSHMPYSTHTRHTCIMCICIYIV